MRGRLAVRVRLHNNSFDLPPLAISQFRLSTTANLLHAHVTPRSPQPYMHSHHISLTPPPHLPLLCTPHHPLQLLPSSLYQTSPTTPSLPFLCKPHFILTSLSCVHHTTSTPPPYLVPLYTSHLPYSTSMSFMYTTPSRHANATSLPPTI